MSEIYFYIVGYDSYEENPEVVLTNEKKYSEDEFQELCAEVTADIYSRRKEIFKKEYDIADEENRKEEEALGDDVSQEVKEAMRHYPKERFGDLMDTVIETLIEKHGFKDLAYTARFTPFGYANFIPKNDWNEYTENDKDLIAIRAKIKE